MTKEYESLEPLRNPEQGNERKLNPYGLLFTLLNVIAVIAVLLYYFSKR